ncbi:pollen allergen Che a 1-like [Salvia splendens]|uniref:pollen allergen Che a 1-like n=1 Tax=Salvia splendens TaxID=180675 RepID=UPI001C25B84C|nr:pollen allergen Che a 1-like [Salvia splendens]
MGLIMISNQYQCLVVVLLLCASACGSGAPAARMKVAVDGVVYCKVCIRNPNNSFHLEAIMAPMEGAVVKLQCNNTNKGPWELETKTDGNARFLFKPERERVSSWGAHKCRIFLVSSPWSDCTAPHRKPLL